MQFYFRTLGNIQEEIPNSKCYNDKHVINI